MTIHPSRPARGFTLVEAAIALAVAAVLAGLSVPDLRRTLAAHAIAAQASAFMASLRFARSEAVKRGEPVTVCAADPALPQACLGRGRAIDWRSGWLVFVDRRARGVIEAVDLVLRTQQPLAHSGGVAGTRASLTYTAIGVATDPASHFLFRPEPMALGPAPTARLVCVSKQGRPRVSAGAACD